MRKEIKLFFIALITMLICNVSPVSAHRTRVVLNKTYTLPTRPLHPRSPEDTLAVYLDENELTFETPCDGCTLQLVEENEDVVYTIIIPADTTTLYLPSDLEGIFELQIISGDWLYYAEIEL